ncbi:MAG: hypothetical protein WD766_08480 [Gemmatimonadota bacterium]
MSKYSSIALALVVGFVLAAGSARDASAQLTHLPYQLKYDRGQTVQPVFEGWSWNPDGTIDMHFGYLNRNYEEELHVPVGADNRFEPGTLDQGQPTFFHVRSNRNIFTVTVPGDFGDERLIWSLTTQGETLSAVGWLEPRWEILETGVGEGATPVEEGEANAPPELTVHGSPFSVTLPARLTVAAMVTDDGKPEPRPSQSPRGPVVGTQDQPPLLTPGPNALEPPVNIPQHLDLAPPSPPRGRATVSYKVWRGPANIWTEPFFAEADGGSATSTITFTEPGEYQLQVSGHDGALSTDELVTVIVR